MADVKNEIQVNFSDLMSDRLAAVQEALPKTFNKQRFIQNSLSVLNSNTQLQSKPKEQLLTGLLRGAYLGLDFMNSECYLIPYGNTVQFQLSYKGSVKFVKKYSIRPIQDIYAKIVRKGDDFTEKVVNGNPTIDFSPLPFNDNEPVGVFAIVLYKDGGMEYETMTVTEINDTRNKYSKAANSDAWKKSWGEMAKKTCLRRLCKHIECDFESIEAHDAWDDGGDMETGRPVPSEIVTDPFAVDVEATEITDESVNELPEFLQGDE